MLKLTLKKALFVVTHLGSGSEELCEWLCTSPRIDGRFSGTVYDLPESFSWLTGLPHKRSDASAIYLDELRYNHSFTRKELLKHCKLIYFVRSPRQTLHKILQDYPHYSAVDAAAYYNFRMRGLAEYALRSPQAMLLTWDESLSSRSALEKYIGTTLRPDFTPSVTHRNYLPEEMILECQEVYDRYLREMRSFLPLRDEKIN
jgi:predicted heme/steroid binding protein